MMSVVGIRWTGVIAGLCVLVDMAGAQITRPTSIGKPWEQKAEEGGDEAFPEKKWYQNGKGYEEARELQKTTGADIIVYFARYYPADEKGLCNWFEQRGLGNPEVEKYLRGYIKVKFLYPLGKADEEAAADFRVGKCPAVYIVPPTGHPNRAPVFEWPAGKPELIKPDVLMENFRSRSSPRYQGGGAPAPAAGGPGT